MLPDPFDMPHLPTRRRVPRFCPRCGEPDPHATPDTVWCPRCTWTQTR